MSFGCAREKILLQHACAYRVTNISKHPWGELSHLLQHRNFSNMKRQHMAMLSDTLFQFKFYGTTKICTTRFRERQWAVSKLNEWKSHRNHRSTLASFIDVVLMLLKVFLRNNYWAFRYSFAFHQYILSRVANMKNIDCGVNEIWFYTKSIANNHSDLIIFISTAHFVNHKSWINSS